MHAQVAALGEVLAQQPVGVLVARPLPGRVWLAEEHRHAERAGDLGVQRQLLALVPGQRTAQRRRQRRHGLHQRVSDRFGGMQPAGQVQQDGEPARPFDQRADRRAVGRASDQVAFPVPGHVTVVGLGRPLIDHRHAGQRPGPPRVRAAVWLAAAPAGPQHPGQVAAQPAQLRAVDRLVDRLVHDVPPGIAGELAAQRVADLLRAPPRLQPVCHELAQHRIAQQLAAAGPGPAAGSQPLRGERPVLPAIRVPVAAQLPADRRRAPAQPGRDPPHRPTAPMQICDRTRSSSDRYRAEMSRSRAPITGG